MLKRIGKKIDFSDGTLLLIAIFAIFFIYGLIVPMALDDWSWGSSVGIDRLISRFADYNGRWSGNLVVLALTRSRAARAFSFGLAYAVIAYFSCKLSEVKGTFYYVLFLSILLCMPSNLFAQTIAWTSGFSNYVISVACMLPILYIMKKTIVDNPQHHRTAYTILSIVLCFITQLFVEHITIYLILISLIFNVIYFIQNKKPTPILVGTFISSIASALVMFSNGAYSNAVSNSSNNYQQINIDSGIVSLVKSGIKEFFTNLYPPFLTNNTILIIVLSCSSILILYLAKPRFNQLLSFIIFTFTFYIIIRKHLPYNIVDFPRGRYIEGLFAIIYLLSILYICISIPKIRWNSLFTVLSICILTGPMLFVKPISPRNFFVTYIFFIMLCMQFWRFIFTFNHTENAKQNLCKLFKYVSIVATLFYLIILGFAQQTEVIRNKSVQQQVAQQATEITVMRLPFEKYFHLSSPHNDLFKSYYRKRYHIPEDTEIVVTDYDKF